MTTKMSEAISELEQLPAETQDRLAESLLAELAWERSLALHPEVLERLADEAWQEIRAGRTEPLDLSQL